MCEWTPELQERLDTMTKELQQWLPQTIAKIKEESGLAPDDQATVCLRCRKVVGSDANGNWFCDCHDERPLISPPKEQA